MFIIVEGPDGAGKTTLVEQLKHQMHAEVLHFSKPSEGDDQFMMYADAITANSGKNIIMDRAWYSELVYGPVMRDGSKLADQHVAALEAMVSIHGGGMIIHCTAPIRTLMSRCNKRGEDYVKLQGQLDAIRLGYYKVLEASTLPVVLNYTGR